MLSEHSLNIVIWRRRFCGYTNIPYIFLTFILGSRNKMEQTVWLPKLHNKDTTFEFAILCLL